MLKKDLPGSTEKEASKERVIRVKPDSEIPEIMKIGHSKKSATFVPGTYKGRFTWCDCPGFGDNRGEEINIANAVNIRKTLHCALSVRTVVIINHSSIMVRNCRLRCVNGFSCSLTHLPSML